MARQVKVPAKEEGEKRWTVASVASLFFLILIVGPSAFGAVEKVLTRLGYTSPIPSRSPVMSTAEMRTKIDDYYKRNNAEKLEEEGYADQADKLARKYKASPKELWKKLEKKYGPDKPISELQVAKETVSKALEGDFWSILYVMSGGAMLICFLYSCVCGKDSYTERAERKKRRQEEKEEGEKKKT